MSTYSDVKFKAAREEEEITHINPVIQGHLLLPHQLPAVAQNMF